MIAVARWVAIAIAVAGVVDPALSREVARAITVSSRLPPASHPGHDRARRTLEDLKARLADRVVFDGPDEPHAILAVGDADLPATPAVPVVALRVNAGPSVGIAEITAPAASIPSQAIPVRVRLRGQEVEGKTTRIVLMSAGVRLAEEEHRWTTETVAEATLMYVPGSTGLQRVRVAVETPGIDTVVGDAGVLVRHQPLRVLTYEPRPSWPVTFVRRALEQDAAFTVASIAHSSRGIATTSGTGAGSLTSVDPGRYDVIIVGALDEFGAGELQALDRFAAQRGGQIVLLPDRRIPASVRTRFGLPDTDEVLLESPATVATRGVDLQASELLVARPDARGVDVLAKYSRDGQDHPAVISLFHGDGRIIVSGLLDTWRYRARAAGAFDRVWRGIIADAALAAPPPLELRVEPVIARPGETVRLRAAWRATALRQDGDTIAVPDVEASVTTPTGERVPVRLWPGPRPGTFEGCFVPAVQGHHIASVAGEGTSSEVPIEIAGDVVQPSQDLSSATSFVAAASGGAVLSDPDEVGPILERLETGRTRSTLHPMRSPWWILPFAGLLTVEWAARRKQGLP